MHKTIEIQLKEVREQVAQEIEAQLIVGAGTVIERFNDGLTEAAAIARGQK